MTTSVPSGFDALRTDELLSHIRAGDQAAWREAYRRYRPFLMLAAKRASNLSMDELEDVVQSCFLNAWSHIRDFEYRGKGSFRAWLRRIVVTRSFRFEQATSRWLRRQKRIPGGTKTTSGWLDAHPDGQRDPLESAAIRDQQEHLGEKMTELLTPDEQELIILRYFEALPMSQILEVMEISRGVSRGLHRSAMDKMARILEDDWK